MFIDIKLEDCKELEFTPIDPPTDKGWGYSFVYSLIDLKNIYIILKEEGEKTLDDILNSCYKLNIKSESGKTWTKRNILEIVNAWVNFGYVEKGKTGYRVIVGINFEDFLNTQLTEKDKGYFQQIFYNYFKFQEFHRLFQIDSEDRSIKGSILAFSQGVRFVNCFLKPEEKILYKISGKHKDMMRFWDVYLKWGNLLNILDKISLPAFGVVISDDRLRNANMVFCVNPIPRSFSVLDFIKVQMPENYLSILDIELELIKVFQFKIDDIKRKIVDECSKPNSLYCLQSTSSNLVKKNNLKYYPMVNNTYVSHLLKV